MHSLSLKFRITALALLVAVIPLLLFQMISATRSYDTLSSLVEQGMHAQANIISNEISRYLNQRITETKIIAQTSEFQRNDIARIIPYVNALTLDNPSINDIDIVDVGGIITGSSVDLNEEGFLAWDYHLGIKELFQTAAKAHEGEVFISEAYKIKSGAELIFLTPFANAENTTNHGIILIQFNIRQIRKIVSEFGQYSIGGKYTYVVNKNGQVIVSTDPSMPLFETLPDVLLQPAMLGESTQGTVIYENSNNLEVMAGFADLPEFGVNKSLNWSVITITPINQITAPATETRNVLTVISLVVALIAVAVAYFFARSLTLPLQRTVSLAEEIRRGNYSHRLEANIGGEIGLLANAINEMVDRVEERTAEIVSRNEKLTSEIIERKLAQDRLKKLSHKIVRMQEEERRRVSRELHDGINQLLVSVKYKIENFEHKFNNHGQDSFKDITKAVGFLDEAISEVRRVSHDLRPSVLDDLGLSPAIGNIARQFSERNQMDVEIEGIDDEIFERLPADVETAMYRIVQEALMNIEKHANATKVVINMTHSNTNVTIRIEDDGDGFSLPKAMRKTNTTNSMGLRNMRERIELLQGTFFIHSDLGKGTFLEVKAPLMLD